MNGSSTKAHPSKRLLFLATGAALIAAAALFWAAPRHTTIENQTHVISFSNDGSVIATMSTSGQARLWDPMTGRLIQPLPKNLAGMTFPLSSGGHYQIDLQKTSETAANSPYQANLVDNHSGQVIDTFRCDLILAPHWMRFTADERHFVARFVEPESRSVVTKVWDLDRGSQVLSGDFWAIAISPDGSQLAILQDRTISLLKVDDQSIELTLSESVNGLRSAAYSSGGRYLAVLTDQTNNSQMQLFETTSGEMVTEKAIPWNHDDDARFIHDDRLIEAHQTMNLRGSVTVWSTETDRYGVVWTAQSLSKNRRWAIRTYQKNRTAVIQVIRVSPDNAALSADSAPTSSMEFSIGQFGFPTSSSISNDGKTVAVNFEGKSIVAVDVVTKRVIIRWSKKTDMRAIHMSPDGRFVAASGGQDHEVYIFTIPERS